MHCFQFGQTVLGSHILVYFPCDRVERSLNRFFKFDLSHIRAAGVLGSVFDLLVHHICSGIIVLLKSRCIDYKRFDRTSGLSVALVSAVESQCGIDVLRSAADHCYDLSRAVVNAYSRSLHLIFPVIRCIFKISEFLVYAILQDLLFFQIKGCVYPVTALEQFGEAGIVKLVIYFVISRAFFVTCEIIAEGEIRVLNLHQGFRRAFIGISKYVCVLVACFFILRGQIQHDLLADSLVILSLRDHPVVQHIPDDEIPSVNRVIGMCQRVIVSRAVGDRAQESCLRKIQLVRSLVEISLAGGRDAVIAVHEVYVIEIKLKDLVLTVFLLKVPGNKDLLDFSLPGSSVVEEDSPGELHRDRTAALRDLPVHREFLRCADDRLIVHASVVIKVLILDADHRFSEQIRDLRGCKIIGILLRMSLGDQVPLRIIDLSGLRGHKSLLSGCAHEGVRFVLQCFYSAIVTAKIENAQDCQDTDEHKQQQSFQYDDENICFFLFLFPRCHSFLRS